MAGVYKKLSADDVYHMALADGFEFGRECFDYAFKYIPEMWEDCVDYDGTPMTIERFLMLLKKNSMFLSFRDFITCYVPFSDGDEYLTLEFRISKYLEAFPYFGMIVDEDTVFVI